VAWAASELLAGAITTWNGAMAAGSIMPSWSWNRSMAAHKMRSMPMPHDSMMGARGRRIAGDCHHRIWLGDPARMQSMAKTLTADDILPLVASLTPRERVRLLRLIALPQGADAPVYRSVPPSGDEFSADEDPLAWDAEGWEDVG
jgi:hypothetical protein